VTVCSEDSVILYEMPTTLRPLFVALSLLLPLAGCAAPAAKTGPATRPIGAERAGLVSPPPPPLVLTGFSYDDLGAGAVGFECYGLPEYIAKHGRSGWLAAINDNRFIDDAMSWAPPYPKEYGPRVSDMAVAYYLRLHEEDTQAYFRARDEGEGERCDAIKAAVIRRVEAGDLPTPVYLMPRAEK
jgi:hypothetical protein